MSRRVSAVQREGVGTALLPKAAPPPPPGAGLPSTALGDGAFAPISEDGASTEEAAAGPPLKATDAAAWVLSCDPATQLPFFFNRVSQESRWHVPAAWTAVAEAPAGAAGAASVSAGSADAGAKRNPKARGRKGASKAAAAIGRRRSLALPMMSPDGSGMALAASASKDKGGATASDAGADAREGVGAAGTDPLFRSVPSFVWCVPKLPRIQYSSDWRYAAQVDPGNGKTIYYDTQTRTSSYHASLGVVFRDVEKGDSKSQREEQRRQLQLTRFKIARGDADQVESPPAESDEGGGGASTTMNGDAAAASHTNTGGSSASAAGAAGGGDDVAAPAAAAAAAGAGEPVSYGQRLKAASEASHAKMMAAKAAEGRELAALAAAEAKAVDESREFLADKCGVWPPSSLDAVPMPNPPNGLTPVEQTNPRTRNGERASTLVGAANPRVHDSATTLGDRLKAEERHRTTSETRRKAALADVRTHFQRVGEINERLLAIEREIEEAILQKFEAEQAEMLRREEERARHAAAYREISRKHNAVRLQRWFRDLLHAFDHSRREAMRAELAAKHVLKREESSSRITALFRGRQARKHVSQRRQQLKQHERVQKIQAVWRGKKDRDTFRQIAWRMMLRKPNDKNLRKLFSVIDASGDGSISVAEFMAAIRRTGSHVKTPLTTDISEQFALFNEIDRDGGGEIDEEEWVTALKGNENDSFLTWMQHTLVTIHEAEEKKASEEEARSKQTALARKVHEARAKRHEARLKKLYKHVDKDGDKQVSVRELMSAIRDGQSKKIKSGRLSMTASLAKDLHAQLALFNHLDEDGSGFVDEEEWVSGLRDVKDPKFLKWMNETLEEEEAAEEAAEKASAEAAAAGAGGENAGVGETAGDAAEANAEGAASAERGGKPLDSVAE